MILASATHQTGTGKQAESKLGDYLMVKLEQTLTSDIVQLLTTESDVLREDSEGFIYALDRIAGHLSKYDPAPSPILNTIDLQGQDYATYFYAAYSENQELDRSILVYKTVKSLVRYILLMDRYYEVGNRRYERIARGLLRTIKATHEGFLKYSISFALEQFWPFWDFEQTVKKRLIKGHSFTSNEIRHFNLFKSSDAPIIYARVLDNGLQSFNPNVGTILHFNQALQDMKDDFEDIEQDLRDRMPIVFLLAASEHVPFPKLANDKNHARNMIISNDRVIDSILTLIQQYNELTREIGIPSTFAFLKLLSRDYTDSLLKTLCVQRK